MKTLVLLLVNLLVTTILAENNVHPKLKVTEINSRNGYVGTDGDQKEMEEHLRNIQKHLSEGSFNLKEIKFNDNFEVKNAPKRYKIKISSRALHDLPTTEHGKTKKYNVVIKRKGVGQKNISADDFENVMKQIKDENYPTKRNNGASKKYRVVFNKKNGSIQDLENVSQEENGKEHHVLDTAEIRKYKTENETRFDQNNASTVDYGHSLSQFTDRNDILTETAKKKEHKLLLKLKSDDQEIKSTGDTDSDRQPEYMRLNTHWNPEYYNQDSYYVNKRPETGYTNIMLPNQHGSVPYIPFEYQNLIQNELLRPRQDTKIRYIYQQDGKGRTQYKWAETENPTDRLLLKLDSDSEKDFKHNYVIEPGNTAYNFPVEQTIKYMETPNRKPIDYSHPNVPLDYKYNNERSDYKYNHERSDYKYNNELSDYYNVYKGLDRDTSIYNPSQRPDPTTKSYSYEVVVPFNSQNTVESRYKNQNEQNKQRLDHLRDNDYYNPYSIEIPKDRNQNIHILRPDLIQDYKNMNFHNENEFPIVSTDSGIKEPLYLDRNKENTAITQPQTINNGPETNIDSIKVISEEIDYNDKETIENTAITQPQTINNGLETNIDPIKAILEKIYYNDKETKENTAITQPQTINNEPETNIDPIKVISEEIDYNDRETKENTAITQPQTINNGPETNIDPIKVVSEEIDYNDKETKENTAITQPQILNNGPETNIDPIKFISEEIDYDDRETKENTAITQPQTINNEPETNIDPIKVISEEIDYNDKETKDSTNGTLLNVIPIHEVKNDNQIEDEQPIIDTREENVLNNKVKGKFPSDVDGTKIKISPIDDVLDLCMKLNVDALGKKFNLNQPKYVADLENFQKLLEKFVMEQPGSPLKGVIFKLLIKVYLVLQQIENPSKSLDTNYVESIGSIMKQTVKSVDSQNTDILEVIKQAVKDLEKPVSTASTKIKPRHDSPEQKRYEHHNSDVIFENQVTEETVNPTLDTISVAPQNLPKNGEMDSQKDELLLEKEVFDTKQKHNLNLDNQPFIFSEKELNHKVEQPLIDFTENNNSGIPEPVENQSKLPQNPIADTISSDISEKSSIETFADPKQIYSIKEQNPVIPEIEILKDLHMNTVPAKNIVTIKHENYLKEPDYTDKQVQIEVDEQHPFHDKYFAELLDPKKDHFNPESVKRDKIFDKEPLIHSIPNSGKSEETFWEEPDKDLVPANNDVAEKPEQGLYEPEQESGNGVIPESEYIARPNHQRVSIPKQPNFDKDEEHPAYNEYFELISDSEILTNFEDSANKPVTDSNNIPEINVLNPELVKHSKESGSSEIYIQPIRVENNKDLIRLIHETVKIKPETRLLIPEQVQFEEDKEDPVYYEYFEELLDPKKDNLSPETIKNDKDSEIKPMTYENPVLENSEETFDLNPNESNGTWNQIDTKPISEYVVERHFDIPKQVKLDEDVHYPGNNDYYEIPRTNINKAPVTNDITPGNSKEVTFTNTKDPVLALLRELESDADSNEDVTPSDKNVNSIDYDLSLKRILEVMENLCTRLRKYNVPGRLIKKIIRKLLIITIRKLEENDIKCSERVKFAQFVSLLKRDVGNINFSSENDIVNVSKYELKIILRFEEIVQLLRQLFEPRLLLVTRVYY